MIIDKITNTKVITPTIMYDKTGPILKIGEYDMVKDYYIYFKQTLFPMNRIADCRKMYDDVILVTLPDDQDFYDKCQGNIDYCLTDEFKGKVELVQL